MTVALPLRAPALRSTNLAPLAYTLLVWIAWALGLRPRARGAHAPANSRGASWAELVVHYVVALVIWSRDDGKDDSALGLPVRVFALLVALTGAFVGLGNV